MAQIYADENFPLPAVEALRTLGHDVLTSHRRPDPYQSTGYLKRCSRSRDILGGLTLADKDENRVA